jgi:hypothetical protein
MSRNEKIARALLKVARELVARGKYVAVKELPDGIRKVLRSMKFRKRDIEVIPSNSYYAGAGGEGNRAMSVTVNLKSGRITDKQMGSWGGSNMFEDRSIDRGGDKPVPNGSVVIAGSSGGHGTFLSIYVRPSDLEDLMPEGDDEVDLTKDEAKALKIMGYKSSYRADQFWKDRLGEYDVENPLIESLINKGLVKVQRNGMRLTTKGQNVRG